MLERSIVVKSIKETAVSGNSTKHSKIDQSDLRMANKQNNKQQIEQISAERT